MLNFLYLIIIYPLFQIIELIYTLSYGVLDNAGLAIIGVSLTVSFLCLPLYIISEKWQEKERIKQQEMKPGIDRIKAVFKGDEQYMILTTFYRQNHYHPAMALRSSLSLLIQIPFFIAAYKFLSHLELLKGLSFFFIKDLGSPDALFYIGSFPVNVLPIAMTLINVLSGVIYSKGHPIKEKIQIFVMAAFFLVLLYDSPSGLVFYWTLNNIFSLVKNVFYKFKKPIRVLYFCLVGAVVLLDYFLLFIHTGFLYRRLILVMALMVIPLCPLILKAINWFITKPGKILLENEKACTSLFITSCIAVTILVGYTLPSYLISSSPTEFSFVDSYDSPFFFLRNTLFQTMGFCLFWSSCIYFLFNKKIKTFLAILMPLVALWGIINAFLFGGDYGQISTVLTFNNAGAIPPSTKFALINIATLLVVFIAILFLLKKSTILNYINIIISISLCFVCVLNSIKISKGYNELIAVKGDGSEEIQTEVSPIFHLSKNKENVLIVMLDRGISAFVPYIFEEKPELYDSFDGFTYYPNTASYGNNTLFGSPLIYGGYEYSPYEMNLRKNEPLVNKHNEALKVLPVLFDKNGFESTVTDMSWANYNWFADLRIYDDYPAIQQKPTMRVYADVWQKNHPEITDLTLRSEILKRNFIWFSFFKIMPPLLRETIYDEGNWWTSNIAADFINEFINNYSVLDLLPQLTDMASDKQTFTILVNEAAHDPQMTGYPDYNLTTKDCGPNLLDDDLYFHVNSSSLYKLGDFFDYLKANDVYNNTRIIIVSDHGNETKLTELQPERHANQKYNALLLVKDFDAHGSLITDNTFMTNADTPLLATQNLIENAANPFTGKRFVDTLQKEKIYITKDDRWAPDHHNTNTFKISEWWSLHDNIFELNNWKEESPFDKEAK